MKLLLDENLSPAQASKLRDKGYDAVAVVECGLSGRPDEAVREFSIQRGRTLVTLDADFSNILRFPPSATPGVIRLRVHPPTETAIADALAKTLTALEAIDMAGKLIVADGRRIRIR